MIQAIRNTANETEAEAEAEADVSVNGIRDENQLVTTFSALSNCLHALQ